MLSSHQIEPELLRPLPRPVRKRAGHQQGFGCIRLFIVPHMVIGAGAVIVALFSTLVFFCGQWVPGEVTGRHTSSDEDGTSYYLEYTYHAGGADYHASSSVFPTEYDSYTNGTPVSVRVLLLLPHQGSQLWLPRHNPARHALLMWGFALFWNGVVGAFVWALYILPLKTRTVVATGLPTVGRIYDKKIMSGEDSATHMIHYEYEPNASTMPTGSQNVRSNKAVNVTPIKRQMSITAAEYNQARIGDVVTVLFNPRNPKHSVVYRYADYEVLA